MIEKLTSGDISIEDYFNHITYKRGKKRTIENESYQLIGMGSLHSHSYSIKIGFRLLLDSMDFTHTEVSGLWYIIDSIPKSKNPYESMLINFRYKDYKDSISEGCFKRLKAKCIKNNIFIKIPKQGVLKRIKYLLNPKYVVKVSNIMVKIEN